MGSLFTSIGKVLNLKFLLILLSIILFIDIYFVIQYNESFWESYKNHLDLKNIVMLFVTYLVSLNIGVPMLGLMFASFLLVFSWIGVYFDINFLNKFSEFIKENELQRLEKMKDKAIKDNNSALVKVYELELDDYTELHTLYLFSFFLSAEIVFFGLNSPEFSNSIIYYIYDFLDIGDPNKFELIDVFLLVIPIIILSLFSIRYMTSFNITKIDKWVKSFK